jgi:hypothetical protein
MPDDQVWALQQKMLKAGLYDGLQVDSLHGTIGDHLAGFDPATIAAYGTLLDKAVHLKMSPTQALGTLTLQYDKQNLENGQLPRFNEKGQPNYDKQGNQLVYNHYGTAIPAAHIVTGAAAVFSEAQAKAVSRLGHTLSSAQMEDLVRTVHDGEVAQANRLTALEGKSGTVEKLTSSDMIDSYLTALTPTTKGKDGVPMTGQEYLQNLFNPEVQTLMGTPTTTPAQPTATGDAPAAGPMGEPFAPAGPVGTPISSHGPLGTPLPSAGPTGTPLIPAGPQGTPLTQIRKR